MFNEKDPAELPWEALDIDIVFGCDTQSFLMGSRNRENAQNDGCSDMGLMTLRALCSIQV
jgi:hypothetical protein